MRLLVLSHKETWQAPGAPEGFATTGGFPFQMQAISELFDQTLLMIPLRTARPPSDLRLITGHNLTVRILPEPYGVDFRRKLALLAWLPRNLPAIWRAIHRADVVHTPVPGDIGMIGLLVALVQRKHIFVRHCGTWGKPETIADRFLFWLLENVASDKNVVMATGWAEISPSKRNPNISWIFSTTLSEAEVISAPMARAWEPGSTLRLITVGRLSAEKNIQAIIRSLPEIQQHFPDVTLDIVGDGEYRTVLEKLALDLGVREQVIFHGNMSHEAVLETLSHSHLFVFPSMREGFPKAVVEAMACCLPVVASNVSVIPYLIRDCGWVLEVPDANHVACAVVELMKTPGRLQSMGEAARLKARSYTLESWQAQIANQLSAAWGRKLHEHA